MGPPPKMIAKMEESDWIIVRMRLDNKTWNDIDAEWQKWSGKKPGNSMLRKRWDSLEAMMCKELNLDVNVSHLEFFFEDLSNILLDRLLDAGSSALPR